MARIFSLEGNIGSGKSTILQKLEADGITVIQEPVDVWESIKDKEGETILSKFYRDQDKYAFPFQMMAYISRLSLLKKCIETNSNGVFLVERSVFTDKYVFAQMLYDAGKIEDVNFKIYLKWFDEFIHDVPISGFIYLKSSPEKCYERVIKRNRTGEEIPLEYLKSCHEYHNNWLTTYSNVLTINGDINLTDTLYTKTIDAIKSFINSECNSKTKVET